MSHAGVSLKGAPDELLLGQLRDWNEELQLARELPSDTDQQKAFRDRTLFKVVCSDGAIGGSVQRWHNRRERCGVGCCCSECPCTALTAIGGMHLLITSLLHHC